VKSVGAISRDASAKSGEVSVAVIWSSIAAASACLVSAFLLIYSTHACREFYAQLQELESTRWQLQEDYGRLVLEQSTWASHYRVEKVARSDLDMVAPSLSRFRVIEK
jgi:cell division protein FtsL